MVNGLLKQANPAAGQKQNRPPFKEKINSHNKKSGRAVGAAR